MAEETTPRSFALSPSRLQTAECPHRYNHLYHLGEEEPDPSHAKLLGTISHDVAQNYWNHLKASGRQSDHDELDRLGRLIWVQRQGPATHWHDYLGFIENLGQVVADDPKLIHSTELALAFDDNWTPVDWRSADARYRSVLDLVEFRPEGGMRVTDWTNAAIGGIFGTKKDAQTRFYGAALHEVTQISPIYTRVVSLRTGREVETELTVDDHEKTKESLVAGRAQIEQLYRDNEWPARPGAVCAYCRLKCPLADDALAAGAPIRVQDHEEAEWMLRQLLVIEQQRANLLAPLKDYVGTHAAVEFGGMKADFFRTSSQSFDTGSVAEILEAAEIDPHDCLKFVKGKLTAHPVYKAMTKTERKELFEAINAHGWKSSGERWGVKKLKEDNADEN